MLELELASSSYAGAGTGVQQLGQQDTGKGRAMALCLVLGCSFAGMQRYVRLGAPTRDARRVAAPAPGATVVGGVYRSTLGDYLPHCVLKWVGPGFGHVFRLVLVEASCLCGRLFRGGALPAVPSY